MRIAILVLISFAAAATSAVAQSDSLIVIVGEPVEHLSAGSDPSLSYALYLPRRAATESSLSVLFLMDPRGRAMLPLELFREAAERHGYVVMSSYNTLSDADSAFAVNARALSAMIVDAQLRFGVDPTRFYLVGFSGTAHYAWVASAQLDGHLAGIVGVGGGLPPYTQAVQAALRMNRPFAYFGTAGTSDFNYDAVRLLDRSLDSTRLAHRFTSFDGPHSWPPDSIAAAAVDWLELQAMHAGLAPRDVGWMDSLCTAYLAEGRRLEEDKKVADAARRYREVSMDCDGLEVASTARDRYKELTRSREVRRIEKQRDELATEVFNYKLTIRDFANRYRADRPPSHERAVRTLKLHGLLRDSSDRTRSEEAAAARRMLASAFATTGFYEPREYMERRDFERAAGMLRLALEIRPEAASACYRFAQAEAQLGRMTSAVDALRCAVSGRVAGAAELRRDPLLAPLAGHQAFKKLLEAAREN